MGYSLIKKIAILGWAIFLGAVISRETPNLSESIVSIFSTSTAIWTGAFVAISMAIFNYVDNVHQKLSEFVETSDEFKFKKVQELLTNLKREIIQNVAFFILTASLMMLLKNLPPSTFTTFCQIPSFFLLIFTALDQGRAGYVSIEMRKETIRKKIKNG
jgi:hypothetical protein